MLLCIALPARGDEPPWSTVPSASERRLRLGLPLSAGIGETVANGGAAALLVEWGGRAEAGLEWAPTGEHADQGVALGVGLYGELHALGADEAWRTGGGLHLWAANAKGFVVAPSLGGYWRGGAASEPGVTAGVLVGWRVPGVDVLDGKVGVRFDARAGLGDPRERSFTFSLVVDATLIVALFRRPSARR